MKILPKIIFFFRIYKYDHIYEALLLTSNEQQFISFEDIHSIFRESHAHQIIVILTEDNVSNC